MKRLMNFSITSLDDMELKGNIRYLEHYLTYFDEYVGLYIFGSSQRESGSDKIRLISVGTGRNLLDFLLAPFRTYREARRLKPTHFLTADLVYGWWHALFLLLLFRSKIVVMPVCTPPEIIKNSGKTYSGYPLLVEKGLITLTFLAAARIIVAQNSGATRRWLASLWCRAKVRVVKATPEELPSIEFYERLHQIRQADRVETDDPMRSVRLIYVGRLEPEKLTGDLVEVAALLKRADKTFSLTLVGDGSERKRMELRAQEAGVADCIRFRGFQPAGIVSEELSKSDIFVSTLTGTSIKEAAFCNLALVAYAIDYVPSLFTDGENCLLAPGGDVQEMAEKIIMLINDGMLRKKLADNLNKFASARWTPEITRSGLEHAFGDL